MLHQLAATPRLESGRTDIAKRQDRSQDPLTYSGLRWRLLSAMRQRRTEGMKSTNQDCGRVQRRRSSSCCATFIATVATRSSSEI